MATFDVFNLKREKVGSIDLADEVFGTEVREHLFYEVVKAQLASKRQGTQCAKNRSAVSGSTKKIYKQKGTGQARHGSIRAPVFVGGGQAHPPRPRDWSYEPPRRARRGGCGRMLFGLVAAVAILVILGLHGVTIPTGNAPAPAPPGPAPRGLAAKVDPGLVDVVCQLGYDHAVAEGTGQVLTPDGEVLTNNHVIDGATSIQVTDIGTGRTYAASVVGYDISADIAVLQDQAKLLAIMKGGTLVRDELDDLDLLAAG